MRRDALYLADMAEAADSVASFVAGVRQEEFAVNDVLRSAVLQKLTVIGEAAARLSADLKAQHPKIPWADIIAFRNIAVHAYFSVDWSIVWATATADVPSLREDIARILSIERPDVEPGGPAS